MQQKVKGRIVRSISGFYDVQTSQGLVTCRARGVLRREGSSPLTGDLVSVRLEGNTGVVEEILPRKNGFVRPAVANVDALVIFAAAVNPVTEPYLIDRVAAIAGIQGVETILCISKCDCDPGEKLARIYRHAGFPVVQASAVTGEGVEELGRMIAGKFTAFTGNSGVGKSSMLNALCPALNLPTGEVSEKLGRGRHTTRQVAVYALGPDTLAADTPGFSAFDPGELDDALLTAPEAAFPEFAPCLGRCRFLDCTHRREPDCAVKQAVAAGEIENSRYQSYLRLYEIAGQVKPWQGKQEKQEK